MGSRKLTAKDAADIRTAYATGKINTPELAARYRVTRTTIWRIVANTAWHDPHYTPRTDRRYNVRNGGQPGFTRDQVAAMRRSYLAGETSYKRLARTHSASQATIGKILRNESWYDPDYTPPPPDDPRKPRRGAMTPERAAEIRQRYRNDPSIPVAELIREYRTSPATIYKVLANTVWRDPEYTPPRRADRKTTGERSGTAKLTWEAVKEIRERYAAGDDTARSLAAQFGVGAAAVNKITRNLAWKDPDYTPPAR